MAFSFGTPAAAAPAPAAFGARSATPAFGAPPAPAFGAAPAAPAPAPAFGAAPAPAFGAPAAAPAFGAAPAPSTGLFGSPAPAPAFGAAPAAPSTSLFGAVGAAPVGGGFGGFGSPPAAAAPQPQQQQQPQASLAGHMSYASLPPNMKQVVDQLHDSMMRHKRSVAQLQTMGPQVLQPVATTSTNKSNAATTTTSTTVDTPLGQRLTTLASHLDTLRARHAQTRTRTDHQCTASEGAVVHATQYAQWRAEQLAVRAGVRVVTPADVAADRYGSHATTTTTTTTTTGGGGGAANTSTTATSKQHDDDLHRKIRQALDVSTAAVDRLDAVPSPYFWHVLHSLEARAQAVQDRIGPIMGSNNHSSHNSHKHTQLTVPPSLTDITNQYRNDPAATAAASWNMVQQLDDTLEEQHVALVRLAADWRVRHDTVEGLRHRYHRYDRDTNVLVERDARLAQRDRQQREGVQRYLLEAAAPMAATTATTTAAPATGGLFGSAPATGGGLFGSAPATGGGLFGSAPAAAPVAGGGLFGSAPAAPATGGLFGSTPAPAAGGLFGSTPAPAPGGLFGAAAPPAPGGLFGSSSTPAPAFGAAPAAAGAFGAAPATPGGFGSAAPATTLLSSKKKSGTRGSRRR